MRTLVLWDIDHTLVSVRQLSGEIYGEVFREVTGHPLERLADMAGRTDRAIMADTLRLHGLEPTAEIMARFARMLAEAFSVRQEDIRARGRVLPGARAALRALADQSDVIQSVLTGNMKEIALYKLAAFELAPFMDFDIGSYGLDDAERPPLVKLAQQRAARKYGETFDAATTVLIGDTPNDVRAGHEGGSRVVAVATGASDEAALRAAGAELVLPDLTDTDAVVQVVLTISDS
ncbi:haloacid dehalogenase-like hydrolase [Actinomadura sp. NBRC 104425]|uniref:HAD family hydrolase n=1 Tax=Actinomadura sp. NBRC 104425 TaxID=3032204 RepID=UPI0025540A48|nr:haloacid dehalogenase-like hydrolase [Actinomadura sp. NBRC 104425]